MQRNIASSTYRITGLHHTYGCTTFSAHYLGKLYLQNHWDTLYLLVSSLKCNLRFLGLVTESQDYTRLIVAPPKV